ncbi:MAG: diacylglycerol/lipid kinase family protein, partial [Rubrobacteraceae bacterium]
MNPTAGRGRALGRRDYVSRFLKEREVEPVWHVTDGPGHAGRIVRELPEDSLAVAVGGDGTVHEVAAACIGTKRVMAAGGDGSGRKEVRALGAGAYVRQGLAAVS